MNRLDFLRTIGVSGLVLSTPGLVHGTITSNTPDLPPLLVDSEGNLIKSVSKWKEEAVRIKGRWLDYMGALDLNPEKPELKVLEEDRPDGLVRQLVEYEGEPGIRVRGYLLRPENSTQPLPGVVALHSTSDNQMQYIAGIQKGRLLGFGYNLAMQGFVVFCPQCFLWHENEDRDWEQQSAFFLRSHPESTGMAKMLFDAQRAVDVLVGLNEVDSSRIGAIGHSLGAKEAFYLGAFDNRVKAIVSNEGGIGIEMSNWDALWYLGKGIHEFGHQHHEVLALTAPKHFLLIGGDGYDGEQSRPYIEAVKPVYGLFNKPQNLQLKNHKQGHSAGPIAESWTYDWMKEHLK